MFKLSDLVFFVTLGLALTGCATKQRVTEGLVNIYNYQMAAAERNVQSRESMDVLSRIYHRYFIEPLGHLDSLTDEEVGAGYQAAYDVAFYSHYYDPESHEAFLLDAGRYFDELTRRGIATDRSALFLHHVYLTSRKFDEAEAIRLRHPNAGIPPLPPIGTDASFDPTKPGVYTLNDDRNALRLRNVQLDLRRTIIIVAGCPISRRAAREIQSNPLLRQAFADGNVIWLGSADTLNLEQLRSWNAELPHSPLRVVYDERQWPSEIDFAAHPNFHFFLEGKRVAFHSGWWPLEGAPAPIIAGLKAIGALRDDHATSN